MRKGGWGLALVGACVVACSSRTPEAPARAVTADSGAGAGAGAGREGATDSGAGAGAGGEAGPKISFEEALGVIHVDKTMGKARAEACGEGDDSARVRCLLEDRFAADRAAAAMADELWTRFGTVAGVEVAHTMDGGYRGSIQIVPELPVGVERKHLGWVVSAMRDFDGFFTWLSPPAEASTYRFRALSFRFMRSVKKRTPTAYAHDWTIAYNLAGSLLVSEDAARETLFHEVFHLNDGAHGWWSGRALGGPYDAIVAKCGHDATCLAPYAPTETMVKGGTYYAFHANNGVVEYAAELALRYYREQRAVQRGVKLAVKPFKCGPSENAKAWERMRDEFFGGVDKTRACP